jgi:hypothetical protein
VSARTGRLLLWERPSFENAEATKAEARLSQYLVDDALSGRLIGIIKKSHEDERIQRTVLTASAEAIIEEAPEDEKAAEVQGLRTPGLIEGCDLNIRSPLLAPMLKRPSTSCSMWARTARLVRYKSFVGPGSVSTNRLLRTVRPIALLPGNEERNADTDARDAAL